MASKDWSDATSFITTKSSGHKPKELGRSRNAKIGHAPQASRTTQHPSLTTAAPCCRSQAEPDAL